jgi:hypothetical protein
VGPLLFGAPVATKSPRSTPPVTQQFPPPSTSAALSTVDGMRAKALDALAALLARYLVAFGATANGAEVAHARRQLERLYAWAGAHLEAAFPAGQVNVRRMANAYLAQLGGGASGPALARTAAIAAGLCRLQAFTDAERAGAFTARQSALVDAPSTRMDPDALARLTTEYLAAPAGYLEGLGGELSAAVVYQVAEDIRRFARERWHATSTAAPTPTASPEGGAR